MIYAGKNIHAIVPLLRNVANSSSEGGGVLF